MSDGKDHTVAASTVAKSHLVQELVAACLPGTLGARPLAQSPCTLSIHVRDGDDDDEERALVQ